MTKTERWELAEVQSKFYNILFILTDQERYFHPNGSDYHIFFIFLSSSFSVDYDASFV